MFELSVASKYLLPRRKHLSASIISLLSVGVISLVVWLVVVFFSVTSGLEKGWTEKMIAMSSPLRLTPTSAYKNSYYARIDSHSLASGYRKKTIREKSLAETSDPYDPNFDAALPLYFPKSEEKDLVKATLATLEGLGMTPQPFETSFGQIRLQLMRPSWHTPFDLLPTYTQQFVSQTAYLASLNSESPQFKKIIFENTPEDLEGLFATLDRVTPDFAEDEPSSLLNADEKTFRESIKHFFESVNVSALAVDSSGLPIPPSLYPKTGKWKGIVTSQGLVIPPTEKQLNEQEQVFTLTGKSFQTETITFQDGKPDVAKPLIFLPGTILASQVFLPSLETARETSSVLFEVETVIQGLQIKGKLPFSHLKFETATFSLPQQSDWFFSKSPDLGYELPYNSQGGYGVLMPKVIKENGILLGDRGFLSYSASTPSGIQEQRLPIFVAGFYDPGIFPLGGRFIWIPPEISSIIVDAYDGKEGLVTQGIYVHLENPENALEAKEKVIAALKEQGLLEYWEVKAYTEFDFVRPVLQQLKSEKLIFSLIAWIIILVACSNIISMLILLVNDKKVEIAILRAMGATSASIAKIFSISGLAIGILSSAFGTLAATLTLYFLNPILSFFSKIQGHDLFQESLYGKELPNELHLPTLFWVLLWTLILSLLSGLIPALKASRMHPTEIFKESR